MRQATFPLEASSDAIYSVTKKHELWSNKCMSAAI